MFVFVSYRYGCFQNILNNIEKNEPGGLDAFTQSYNRYGLRVLPDKSIHCLEWAPAATGMFLWGDFSEYS